MPRCGVPFNSSMVSDKVVPQTNQTKGLTKGGDFARSASRRSLVCFTIIAFGRIAGLVNRHNSNRGLACANGFPAYEVCKLIISTLMGGGHTFVGSLYGVRTQSGAVAAKKMRR